MLCSGCLWRACLGSPAGQMLVYYSHLHLGKSQFLMFHCFQVLQILDSVGLASFAYCGLSNTLAAGTKLSKYKVKAEISTIRIIGSFIDHF